MVDGGGGGGRGDHPTPNSTVLHHLQLWSALGNSGQLRTPLKAVQGCSKLLDGVQCTLDDSGYVFNFFSPLDLFGDFDPKNIK